MDRFGEDLALDGERIAVGAPFDNGAASDGGAVYLFERQVDGSWREVVKLMAADTDPNHHVGASVSLNGTTVAATAAGAFGSERHVHVFEESGGAWIEVATLVPPDGPDHDFSTDVALDGDTLLVGAELDIDDGANPGSVYVFERDAGGTDDWGPVAKLIPSDAPGGDRFGHSVDIAGDTLVGGARDGVVGSDEPGAAYVYQRDEAGSER